ncbi:MAG: hypothetical protein LLG00_08295 [Planctomycetaceae bacterium]|nr:hypothetical protein [Planctomycetaceae bacterium]
MRTSKRKQLIFAKLDALAAKRSAISKQRKEKRREEGKAADIARAIRRSPEGKRTAEIRKEKRGIARKKEQANFQRTKARSATRLGGRRKQIQAELHDKRSM